MAALKKLYFIQRLEMKSLATSFLYIEKRLKEERYTFRTDVKKPRGKIRSEIFERSCFIQFTQFSTQTARTKNVQLLHR
jgi:hypothetical protein